MAAAAAALLLAVLPSGPVAAREGERSTELALRQARVFALHQMARTERRLAPGRFPTVAVGDRPWRTSGTNGWLAGFWPGRLWLAYEVTGRRAWARHAVEAQAPLAVRRHDTGTHDLGFLLQTSFGRGAHLAGRASDEAVLRDAATALASRWVPRVQAVRSWDGPPGQVTVIVDNLMNLELLFRAAARASRPEWRDLAVRHALATRRWHLRPDGSTFHVVRLDEATGDVVWKGTVQGRSDASTWARGQSWAVHGFTTAYRESGDPRLLDAARRTARWAVRHLPRDGVPWWDYDAPGTRRDTTAAAVLASGLLDLALAEPGAERRARWRRAGMHTLRSLVGPRYLARSAGGWAVLRHGRHSPVYDDAGVTYGDHYLLEALQRVQLLPSGSAVRPVRRTVRLDHGGLRVDLGGQGKVSAVSVRWRDGARHATRFRLQVSTDGRTWRTVRAGVSSGRSGRLETYDVPDSGARFVRVRPLPGGSRAAGTPTAVVVRG